MLLFIPRFAIQLLANLKIKKGNSIYSINNISQTIKFDFSKLEESKCYFIDVKDEDLSTSALLIPLNLTLRSFVIRSSSTRSLIIDINKSKNEMKLYGDISYINTIIIHECIVKF